MSKDQQVVAVFVASLERVEVLLNLSLSMKYPRQKVCHYLEPISCSINAWFDSDRNHLEWRWDNT